MPYINLIFTPMLSNFFLFGIQRPLSGLEHKSERESNLKFAFPEKAPGVTLLAIQARDTFMPSF